MQSSYYSSQIVSKLQAIVDNGISVSGTDLSTVATNTTDISSDTSFIEDHTQKIGDCVWVAQNQLKVDLKSLNDTTVDTNSGLKSAGSQRVCIATDDVNISTLTTNSTSIATNTLNTATNTSGIGINTLNTVTNLEDVVTNTALLSTCVISFPTVAEDQLKIDIKTLNDTTIETNIGNVSAGVQRVCIASDDVNLSELYQCVDHVNKHLEVDTNAINGVTMAVNSGNLNNGTQRICTATDDVNLAGVSTEMAKLSAVVHVASSCAQVDLNTIKNIAIEANQGYLSNGTPRVCIATDDVNLGKLLTNSSGDVNAFNVNLRGVRFGGGDVDITSANGNVTQGTLRVTVADNDTNLAAINASLVTLNSTLTDIYTILNDVWDDTANALRTV